MIQPQVMETIFPTEDLVIASLVVEPPGGGEDATGAIQAAVDEVAAAGGGVVFLPAGRYRLDGQLVLKEGVTLRGDWSSPDKGGTGQGTLLMPMADRGNPDGPPAITLERGSGLREVTVWYPEQSPTEVVPYPWTLRTSGSVGGDNSTVHNVTLVNPYQAIKIGPEWNELHTLRHVFGTPLKTGVWIDTCTDIGRLIDVHFGPRWWEESGLPGAPTTEAEKEAVRTHLAREGMGLDLGRSDWEYLYELHFEGYQTGVRIRPGEQGTTNAVMFGSEWLDCGVALRLERLNPIGLAATACRFAGRDCAVLAPGSFDTVAQFNACEFGGTPPNAVRLEGRGLLTFQNCTFTGWCETAVEAQAGSLSLLGCEFGQAGSHVRLGEGVRRARLLGNRFAGEPGIEKASRGDVQVTHHDFGFARPDTSPHVSPPDPRPANRELFVATDFGAGPNEADHTAAFQRALEAARSAGGGTVYVPAGLYRFSGELVVPTGVELRGCFDVPHHTVSGGSVLMPTGGRGREDGTPFIRLEPRSGLRGLTIWYPEQNLLDVQPYPWAVQSLGPGCWLLDVTLGNAYQGVDFWTHPSNGHRIRYLAGAMLKRGLFVSKCDGAGWVEDVQFNPHYSLRLHASLPHPPYEGDVGGAVIDTQRKQLEGIVFGRCAREHVKGTFLYAAYDGIAFRDDDGGANARVIQHGTDTGSRAAVLETVGEQGVEFLNAQLVPLGQYEVGGIIVEDSFAGRVAFFNSQMWAGRVAGLIGGRGDVLIQQFNNLTGPFTLRSGNCRLENVHFTRDWQPHVRVEAGCEQVQLLGNVSPGPLLIDNQAGERCYARANSLSLPPAAERFTFRTGWEPGEPEGLADTVATQGGGRRTVSQATCRPVEAEAHTGQRVLRIAGQADDPSYSYVYFKVFEEPVGVHSDTVLSYWVKPLNERGRRIGVDLLFTDGSTLRDSGARTADGQGVHPGGPRGVVGEWTEVNIPLGRSHAGRVIAAILVAYDSRDGGGPFEAWIDDLALDSEEAELPWRVTATPGGGVYEPGVRVALQSPDGAPIRYTRDGTTPTADSPLYEEPMVLDRPGLWEVRFAAQAAGRLSSRVWGELYEVKGN